MPSAFGTTGGGYDTKRSQAEIKNDKDWIPLVETETEVTVTKSERDDDIVSLPPPSAGRAVSSSGEKKWPDHRASSGTWNEPASWESSRAQHTRRATLERRPSAGGRWKVSMDI